MVNVLNELGFKYYEFDGVNFEVLNQRPQRYHGCDPDTIPNGFEVIASIRNPFSQLVSEYRYGTVEGFGDWLKKTLKNAPQQRCFNFQTRKPNYVVRLENMYEDYSKIPFVVESKYYQLGILKKVVQFKMNPHPQGKSNWKDYFDESRARLVIQSFPYHFSEYHYDINSWR